MNNDMNMNCMPKQEKQSEMALHQTRSTYAW